MSDYISRQAAEEALARWNISFIILSHVPTADVVEVVRCKDCKHIKEEHFNIMPDGFSCELSGLMVEPEHYCSYGERTEA